ncbi:MULTISPECIES: hypothetical protein [unclassified Paenibacillus]|uniref:hypothetical protein n=1 Tax=unclassified Paenibacillus TaxID=185978 RepID=UPI002F3E4593
MFTGKALTLSRILQIIFIVSFIVAVIYMLFNRNEIEVGKTYEVLEGSFVTQSIGDMELLDQARRTPEFKQVLEKLEVERVPNGQRVLVTDKQKAICGIENEQIAGYVSCQSIIK